MKCDTNSYFCFNLPLYCLPFVLIQLKLQLVAVIHYFNNSVKVYVLQGNSVNDLKFKQSSCGTSEGT